MVQCDGNVSGTVTPKTRCHQAEAIQRRQIAFTLGQVGSGTAGEDIARKLGISDPTCVMLDDAYPVMRLSEVLRLKPLKDENAKRK